METLVERIQKALGIWRSDGAPLIYPGPGENYEDLESASAHLIPIVRNATLKLLSNGSLINIRRS